MAEITELTFVGDWRITVVSKSAGWSQRVATTGSSAGTAIVDGVPGQSLVVFGNGTAPWILRIEHNDGSTGWQPNWLRATSSISGRAPVDERQLRGHHHRDGRRGRLQ